MMNEAYARAEIEYRQNKLRAEADEYRLHKEARKARRAGREHRLVAAVTELAPRLHRRERAGSVHRAA